MTRRVTMILLVAFAVALGAAFVAYRLIRNTIAKSSAMPATSQVVVAKRDLEVGTIVKKDDVTMGQWLGALPKGAVVREQDVLERGVVSNLYQGEPILESRLAKLGSGGGMGAIIPPGMRASSVRVDQVVGVAGFAVPGMRVDVLIMGTPPGGTATEGPRVKTVLQNVEVLSAGQNIQKDAEGKPVSVQVVTLLVTPEQAEVLSLASNESRIQLVLRNPLDTETAKTEGSTLANLFGGVEPSTPKPATRQGRRSVALPVKATTPRPPETYLIDVINGARKEQAKFAKTDAVSTKEVRP